MRYELTPSQAVFTLENPPRKPSVATLSLDGLPFDHRNFAGVIKSVSRLGLGKRLATQRNMITHILRPFVAYFRETKTAWPKTSNEWQILLLSFFQFYLTDESWSKASPQTRMTYWSTLVSGMFDFLIEEEVLPCDVLVPTINKKHIKSLAKERPMLGTAAIRQVATPSIPQKLLVNVDFGKTDADYLESIEADCRSKIELIKETCLQYWGKMIADMEVGSKIASTISDAEVAAAFKSEVHHEKTPQGKKVLLASTSNPRGHIWALALVRFYLGHGASADCVSTRLLRGSGILNHKALRFTSYQALCSSTTLEAWQFDLFVGYAQLYRFAGILSPLDAAVACCLLTIEHPEFTSESLQKARLVNARGKPYLLLTDNTDSSILSVDKPRAGKRKSVALSPLAQKVVLEIIKRTAGPREVLRRSNDKAWRYLFIGFQKSGHLGILDAGPRQLTHHERVVSLNRLYPSLRDQGLTTGRLDYRRIRTTMGVLRWFETGSIQEMSRKLGNSYKVAIAHYLPPPLLQAWNTRIIRRFQNTLIVLAAHDEPYLLDVTDFSSASDLQHFIAQLILDYPADTSPLAAEVQSRLSGAHQDNDVSTMGVPGVLSIRLSASSLTYLYAFSDFAVRTLTHDQLHRVDTQSRLAPIQFIDLAKLMRHAGESHEARSDLSELLDLPRLREIHRQAIANQPALDEKLKHLKISNQWEPKDESSPTH